MTGALVDLGEEASRVTPSVSQGADLQYEGGGDEVVQSRCRSFAGGLQRLDFLTDLTDDLAEGRLCLPKEDLDRFGVARAVVAAHRIGLFGAIRWATSS